MIFAIFCVAAERERERERGERRERREGGRKRENKWTCIYMFKHLHKTLFILS